MCFNEHHNFYNNLIIEEKKHVEKRATQKSNKTCKKKRINERKRGRKNIIHRQLFVFQRMPEFLKHVNPRRK